MSQVLAALGQPMREGLVWRGGDSLTLRLESQAGDTAMLTSGMDAGDKGSRFHWSSGRLYVYSFGGEDSLPMATHPFRLEELLRHAKPLSVRPMERDGHPLWRVELGAVTDFQLLLLRTGKSTPSQQLEGAIEISRETGLPFRLEVHSPSSETGRTSAEVLFIRFADIGGSQVPVEMQIGLREDVVTEGGGAEPPGVNPKRSYGMTIQNEAMRLMREKMETLPASERERLARKLEWEAPGEHGIRYRLLLDPVPGT